MQCVPSVICILVIDLYYICFTILQSVLYLFSHIVLFILFVLPSVYPRWMRLLLC